jgi:nucleotide-binding universal stress UspA family protein
MFEMAVLGLDGSESSDRALACATALAKRDGMKIHVVHAVEVLVGRAGGPLHLDEDQRKAKIAEQVAELKAAGIDAELEVHGSIAGGPAHVMTEAAERIGADLIIVGTRGHTAAVGILVGSVSQRLLHIARCPVLVVPESAQQVAIGLRASAAALATG